VLDDQHSLICWSNNIALFTYNYDISTYYETSAVYRRIPIYNHLL